MPAEIRDKNILKKPFGTLVLERDITKERILSMLANAKKIITVGDASTERLITFGITPDIAVIDGLERRSRRDQRIRHLGKEMSCTNPAGMISKEAIHVLETALKTPPPVTVKVQGEEDLLALPLFIMAPKGSAVLYGQPLQGIVLVNITDEKKIKPKI